MSLFSANVAKCLHFCITATINLPSLLFPPCTSLSPALYYLTTFFKLLVIFLPSRFVLCSWFFVIWIWNRPTVSVLDLKKRNFLKFSLSSRARPSFPPSYSLPSLLFNPLISCPSLFLSLHNPLKPPPLLLFHPSILHASPPPPHLPSAPSCPLSVTLILFLSRPILLSVLSCPFFFSFRQQVWPGA